MPRPRRNIQPGFCYHIMLRGNNGQNIFKSDEDRARFCLLLQYVSAKYKLSIHGFCLMGNHIHSIIEPHTTDLTSGMHALAFRYAQYFNQKYNRKGYLYQGRFKAILVQSGAYLVRLARYVHLNPVRAGIVKSPDDYRWSSYSGYTGDCEYTWLEKKLVFDGFSDNSNTLRQYTEMSDEANNELVEIRKSMRTGAYGNEAFLEKWHPVLHQKVDKTISTSLFLDDVIEIVCTRLNISLPALKSSGRARSLVQARTILTIVIQKIKLCPIATIAKTLDRDPTSLSKLQSKGQNDAYVMKIAEEIITDIKNA